VAKFKSDEMLLITVLALCFGVSLLVAKLEYSVALGAFMIGAIIAESREIGKIVRLVEPIRDMFSAVFFVAIGMLINPVMLIEYVVPIAVITVAVVVGKVVTCSFGTFIAGHDTRTSMRVGMGLAQIGEFSFIIASLGLTLNVTSDFLYPIAVTVSAITTLLTPYLIKSSDRVVSWFDRVAPGSLVGYLKLYGGWVESRGGGRRNQATRLLRKWAWQMGLNVALITGVFIVAAHIAQRTDGLGFQLPDWIGGPKSFLWFSAALVTLPFFIATFRKLQAVSILVADVSVTRAAAGENAPAIRAAIANTILVVGVVGLCLWVLLIGTALLPPWPVLAVLLSILAVVTAVLWRFFIQIHRKARFALNEILLQSPPPPSHESRGPVPILLRDVELETVTISVGSPAAGKLIRELQLRTKTGASAVVIERGGVRIINPGADEELKAGDQLLLLGHRHQLDAARGYLDGQAPDNSNVQL
jgi:monovalent cation:H+ antiporter-2, CPA2 family